MFSPFALIAILATAIVCSLLGNAWNEAKLNRVRKLLTSANKREGQLLGLLHRERLEREDSGVRERVAS